MIDETMSAELYKVGVHEVHGVPVRRSIEISNTALSHKSSWRVRAAAKVSSLMNRNEIPSLRNVFS